VPEKLEVEIITASAKERFLKELQIGSGKPRPVRAPQGAELLCKGWHQEVG